MKSAHKRIVTCYLFVSMIGCVSFITSCNKDDGNKPATDFIDRPLTGLISNITWDPLTSFSWEDSNYPGTVTIQMSELLFEDPCSNWSAQNRNIAFRVDKSVGLYKIDDRFLDQYYFYILDDDLDFWEDAKKGKVEILSLSPSVITGRVYAKYNDSNEINGNFTVTNICTN